MTPGTTRMCVLPFTTPSVEPNGDLRLCSAASTYAYLHETNMGNCRDGGLGAVWRNDRFQRIRASLLTGEGLTPYCETCEYRNEGPPWVLQLHLALHAFNQRRAPELLAIIERHADRYEEYRQLASELGLWVEALPDALRTPGVFRYEVSARGGTTHIAFRQTDEWADATFRIRPFDLARLAACTEGSLGVRYRVASGANPHDVNLRLSIEGPGGEALYAFPLLQAAEGEARAPLSSFRTDRPIPPGRPATHIRIGGLGPAGTTLSLASVEMVLPGNLFETDLNPYREQAKRQDEDIDRLTREVQRLSALESHLREVEAWMAPVRRALAFVPRPLRRAGKRVLSVLR